MDFDPCFGEGRTAHNPASLQCQRFKSPIETQGQGDCKCTRDYEKSQNFWANSDTRKKFRSIFKEDNDSDPKHEEEKKFLDSQHDYFAKQDFSGKFRKKTELENFEIMSCSWNCPYSTWISRIEAVASSELPRCHQYANGEEMSRRFFEFEQKVDFLSRVFKDYGQKFSADGLGQTPPKAAVGNILYLLDLNSRMSVVEEGIRKLATILEEVLKDPKKGKASFLLEDNVLFSDPLNLNEMTVTQRLSYLETKNELLKGLIQSFINVGSYDDIHSRMKLFSKDYKFKPTPFLNSNEGTEEKQRSGDDSLDEIMETLKRLKKQMADAQSKCFSTSEPPPAKNEKPEECSSKFQGDDERLEAIAEQAELVFNEATEPESEDGKRSVRSHKENTLEVKEKRHGNDFIVHDVSTRLSDEEAELLNSSLKKVQLELFSSLDANEKKFFKTTVKEIRIPGKEETRKSIKPEESAIRCTDDIDVANKSPVSSILIIGKIPKHEESSESVKTTRISPERTPYTITKQMDTDDMKKPIDHSDYKKKVSCKIPLKNNLTMPPSYSRGRRSDHFAVEDRSPVRHHLRPAKEERQRPATEPSTRNTLSPLRLKPPVPERSKKSTGLNIVKNKNKNLLSKKSFVQTP